MLTLTRHCGESIMIGDAQTVVVALTPADRSALERCADVGVQDLARRLLAAPAGPLEVSLRRIMPDRAWIGVAAPHEVPVHRREIYERIQRGSGGRRDAA